MKPIKKRGRRPRQRRMACQKEGHGGYRGKDYMERSALYKGQRWRDLRFSFLAQNPECVLCGDVATVVDHFHGHGQGWQERFFRWDCLRALCASCHGKQRDSRASGLLRLEK